MCDKTTEIEKAIQEAAQYEKQTKEFLEGKTIVKAVVDGGNVELTFSDKTSFCYNASDGGYSTWELIDKCGNKL